MKREGLKHTDNIIPSLVKGSEGGESTFIKAKKCKWRRSSFSLSPEMGSLLYQNETAAKIGKVTIAFMDSLLHEKS